jgi:hypothetical protein
LDPIHSSGLSEFGPGALVLSDAVFRPSTLAGGSFGVPFGGRLPDSHHTHRTGVQGRSMVKVASPNFVTDEAILLAKHPERPLGLES